VLFVNMPSSSDSTALAVLRFLFLERDDLGPPVVPGGQEIGRVAALAGEYMKV